MIELYLAFVPVAGAIVVTALVAAILRLRYRHDKTLDLLPNTAGRASEYPGPLVAADDEMDQRRFAPTPLPLDSPGANAIALDEG